MLGAALAKVATSDLAEGLSEHSALAAVATSAARILPVAYCSDSHLPKLERESEELDADPVADSDKPSLCLIPLPGGGIKFDKHQQASSATNINYEEQQHGQ